MSESFAGLGEGKTLPQEHNLEDTDKSSLAGHHTLGINKSQASPGNHTHRADDATSVPIFDDVNVTVGATPEEQLQQIWDIIQEYGGTITYPGFGWPGWTEYGIEAYEIPSALTLTASSGPTYKGGVAYRYLGPAVAPAGYCNFENTGQPISCPGAWEVGSVSGVLQDETQESYIHLWGSTGSSYHRSWYTTYLTRLDIPRSVFDTLNVIHIGRKCVQDPYNSGSGVETRFSWPGITTGSIFQAHPDSVTLGMAQWYVKTPYRDGGLLPATGGGSCVANFDSWVAGRERGSGTSGGALGGLWTYSETQQAGITDEAWAQYTSVAVGEQTPIKVEVTYTQNGGGSIDISLLGFIYGTALQDPWAGTYLVEQGTGWGVLT